MASQRVGLLARMARSGASSHEPSGQRCGDRREPLALYGENLPFASAVRKAARRIISGADEIEFWVGIK